jgi:hypothetical protein
MRLAYVLATLFTKAASESVLLYFYSSYSIEEAFLYNKIHNDLNSGSALKSFTKGKSFNKKYKK